MYFDRLKKERESGIRFCVAGGVSTLADFLIYQYALSVGCNIVFSKVISTGIVLICSYMVSKKWTFRSVRVARNGEFFRYVFCQTVNLTVNAGANYIFVMGMKNINLSFVLATGIATVINFLLQRFFVFGGRS